MTVRVNLLPDDLQRKERANQRNVGIASGFLVLLVLIAGLYFLQVQRVSDAQATVDEEQEILQALQADLADLQEFAELEQLREDGDRALQAALSGEASFAGVLQDIAAVMPSDAQLDTVSIALLETTEAEFGDVRPRHGTVTMSGQTRSGHAPGLERLLLDFDKIATFSDVYFSNSTVDERGISTFSAEIDLGPEIRTDRYADGLPEELR